MNVPKRLTVAGALVIVGMGAAAVQAQQRPPASPHAPVVVTFPTLPKNLPVATIPAKPQLEELHLPPTARHIPCADAGPWLPPEWKVPINDPKVERYCWVDEQNQVHVIMSSE